MLPENFRTNRLILRQLTRDDTAFIIALVNTPGWLAFIGDRNIRNKADATGYILKLTTNPKIHYWVVELQDERVSIGVVTFIKRDYLPYYDIGFAFLPEYTKQGYAYEATIAVMNHISTIPAHTHILATTLKENIHSIRLLEKLGLQFDKEIQVDNEALLLYAVALTPTPQSPASRW